MFAASQPPAYQVAFATLVMSVPGNGEVSSRGNRTEGTLSDVLREPSKVPEVVLLESMPEGLDTIEVLDPKEDLWLATNDG